MPGKEKVYWVKLCSRLQNRYVEGLSTVPQNVTLLGNRVVEDVISQDEVILE